MSHYRLCPGGYSAITENKSKNNIAGLSEITLVKYYKTLGLRTAMGEIEYVRHLGGKRHTGIWN